MTRWITGSWFLRRAPDPVSRVNVPVFVFDALDAFGGKLWFAMTVVIASGLAVGTILTLGVVRVLYSLFFDLKRDSREEVKAVGTP